MTNYLTTKEAAERLRISPQTMRLWRIKGGVGPRFTKPSRSRVLYADDELRRFLEERTYGSTSEMSRGRDAGSAAAADVDPAPQKPEMSGRRAFGHTKGRRPRSGGKSR